MTVGPGVARDAFFPFPLICSSSWTRKIKVSPFSECRLSEINCHHPSELKNTPGRDEAGVLVGNNVSFLRPLDSFLFIFIPRHHETAEGLHCSPYKPLHPVSRLISRPWNKARVGLWGWGTVCGPPSDIWGREKEIATRVLKIFDLVLDTSLIFFIKASFSLILCGNNDLCPVVHCVRWRNSLHLKEKIIKAAPLENLG